MFVQLKKDWLGNKAGAVIDLPEPGDADLLIKGGVAEALHHDPLAPILAKSMGAIVEGFTKSLDAAITKAVEEIAKAQTLSHIGAVERIFGSGESISIDWSGANWSLAATPCR
jgi:hypothetical protein